MGSFKFKIVLLSLYSIFLLIKCDTTNYNDEIDPIGFESRIGTDDWDFGASIIQTQELSYYLSGYATPYNNWYSWLAKLDKHGKEEWMKSYQYSFCSDMILVNGTELVALFNNNDEIQFAKMNLNGDLLFTKRLKMFDFSAKEVGKLIGCSDGNYIISGWSDSLGAAQGPFYGFMTKINSVGETIWKFTFRNSVFSNSVESNDGYYYGVGAYKDQNLNVSNSLIVKIKSDGTLIWSRIFNSTKFGGLSSVVRKNDNEIIISGREDTDMLALKKIDSNGNVIWETNYLGNSSQTWGNSVTIDNFERIVVLGTIIRNGIPMTVLIHFDDNGNILSEKEFEGEYSPSLKTTSDNGLVFFAQSTSDSSFHARDILVYKLAP